MRLDDHTRLLNICYHLGTAKNPLFLESYDLKAVEKSINDCAPDLIFHSNKHNSTLLLEAKSGKNIDQTQLAKFLKITTEELAKHMFFSPSEPKRCSCVVMYAGFNRCKDRLENGIKNHTDKPIGLIIFDDNTGKISCIGNISPNSLKEKLEMFKLQLPFPTQYYPFTDQTNHLEILHEVATALKDGFMKQNKISKNKEFYGSIHPAWKNMGQGKQKELTDLIDRTLNLIRQEGLITISGSKIMLKVSKKEFQIKAQEKINTIQTHESVSEN